MRIIAMWLALGLTIAGCAAGEPAPDPEPAGATSAAAQPRSFTVAATGDVLLHDRLQEQAQQDAGGTGYDFVPMLAAVRPLIAQADLAICHLETPIAPASGPFSGYPVFKVPPQIIPALAATGYDACSTASNHSIDDGEEGVRRTLDGLDQAGLTHAGTARSPQERATPTVLQAAGVRVGLLSYSFSFNGLLPPQGKEWLANLIDVEQAKADAAQARRHGAEVVIVSLHAGTEYQHAPNQQQLDTTAQLLADPAIDLILGHHVHVVQPIEVIDGKWVAYGLGNHLSNQYFSPQTRDGIIARFTFTETGSGGFAVTGAEAIPTYMQLGMALGDDTPERVLLVSDCPPRLAAECLASGERTAQVLRSRQLGDQQLMILQ